jgi:hypothetical protein
MTLEKLLPQRKSLEQFTGAPLQPFDDLFRALDLYFSEYPQSPLLKEFGNIVVCRSIIKNMPKITKKEREELLGQVLWMHEALATLLQKIQNEDKQSNKTSQKNISAEEHREMTLLIFEEQEDLSAPKMLQMLDYVRQQVPAQETQLNKMKEVLLFIEQHPPQNPAELMEVAEMMQAMLKDLRLFLRSGMLQLGGEVLDQGRQAVLAKASSMMADWLVKQQFETIEDEVDFQREWHALGGEIRRLLLQKPS